MEISITESINEFLFKKGISKSKLGEMIGHSRQNISKKLAKNDIDVGLLFEICKALNHDFFSDISKKLPQEAKAKNAMNSTSEIEEALKNFMEKNYPEIVK